MNISADNTPNVAQIATAIRMRWPTETLYFADVETDVLFLGVFFDPILI